MFFSETLLTFRDRDRREFIPCWTATGWPASVSRAGSSCHVLRSAWSSAPPRLFCRTHVYRGKESMPSEYLCGGRTCEKGVPPQSNAHGPISFSNQIENFWPFLSIYQPERFFSIVSQAISCTPILELSICLI